MSVTQQLEAPPRDTSVIGSVSPIVDLLDGVADNILPSGHLRLVITLPFTTACSPSGHVNASKDRVWRKTPDLKITSWLFSILWQPFNMIDPLIALSWDWLEGYRERETPPRWPWVNRKKRESAGNLILPKHLQCEHKGWVLFLQFLWDGRVNSDQQKRMWDKFKIVFFSSPRKGGQ